MASALSYDMPGVLAVYGHVDDGTGTVTVMPAGPDRIHHPGIAHADRAAFHAGLDALPGNLLHICHRAAVGGLVGESRPESLPYRMCGEMLHVGGQMQQLVLVEVLGMNGLHCKLAFGKGSCLVEHYGADTGQRVHIVAPLDEYAFTRGSSQSAEKCQRYADDQSTGT